MSWHTQIYTKNRLAIFSPLPSVFQMFSYFSSSRDTNNSRLQTTCQSNLNIEAKQRKLSLICEPSEAKRTWLFPKFKLAKRSELVYFKNWQYRSEANRFDSDFVFKKTKKANFRFFKNEGQKTKGFAIMFTVSEMSIIIPKNENMGMLFKIYFPNSWFYPTFVAQCLVCNSP